jgi:hypothetical protein
VERGFVWELNLDAERELATAGSYTRSLEQQRFVVAHRDQARAMLGAGDVALEDVGLQREDLRGRIGRAWCPTPGALARLRRVGALIPEAPTLEVLREVNGRRFCAELGQTLDGAVYSAELDVLLARLEDPAGPANWLAKRELGVAGRGRLKLGRGTPSVAELSWLRASLRGGGLQHIDAHGSWLATHEALESELLPGERAALMAEGERVAEALAERGYFGPFGIDSYRYRDDRGRARLQPRSEVNARYTMGWRLRELEGAR